jgi:hypothetical protein
MNKNNIKQPFSIGYLLLCFLTIFAAFFIAAFFSPAEIEIVVLFPVIMLLLLMGFTFLLTRFLPLYGIRKALILGIICGMMMYFGKHLIRFDDLASILARKNIDYSFLDYLKDLFLHTKTTRLGFSNDLGLFGSICVELINFIILCFITPLSFISLADRNMKKRAK